MKNREGSDSAANRLSLASVSNEVFEYLGRTFPVACSSDEFVYFPQIRLPEPEWDTWDQFSPDGVKEAVERLSSWERELNPVGLEESDPESQIDAFLLKRVVRTLREQLAEVRSWEIQPTFYLNIACTGLAEAMESEDPAAMHYRLRSLPRFLNQAAESEDPAAMHYRSRSLPRFLNQAAHNLKNVPALFQEIGLEMVSGTRNYLVTLLQSFPELEAVLTELDRFEEALKKVSTCRGFVLQKDLLERIIRFHLHCDMDINDTACALEQEIEKIKSILVRETKDFFAGKSGSRCSEHTWLEALRNIAVPRVGRQEPARLYGEEISRLAEHCMAQGLVSPHLVSSCPVSVLTMPAYLSAIRVGASYSIPPGYPPIGGKFYITAGHPTSESRQVSLREYRMTCAHETYPGHHLLDSSRWGLKRPLRRHIEYPVFYEGWACFAEELMKLTGYFSKTTDRLLLARRRLSHAVRGRVDIGLQTGTMNPVTAAKYLEDTGVSRSRARALARKYTLNPGYQLCYTIGLQKFQNLLRRYGSKNLSKFMRTVLSQGEILFTDLEKILQHNQ